MKKQKEDGTMAIVRTANETAKPWNVRKQEKKILNGAENEQAGLLPQTNTLSPGESQSPPTRTSPENTKGISGLSDMTRSGLMRYGQLYAPSASVTQAQDYLNSVMNSGPGMFQSKYAGQIASLYDQIMNRPKFSYDVNRDPLFQQYKTQYVSQGQRAMQDVMGQSAALTGGYGNSWGSAAGYQAYQRYLQLLNDRIPELEQRAFDRYQYDGDELRRNMNLASSLYNAEYSQYRDAASDWKAAVSAAESAYSRAASADLSAWKNLQDYYRSLAQMENENYWKTQDMAYQRDKMDRDDAYRRDQLAQSQSQYEQNLAYQREKTALDEAYRRDQLAQDQSQYLQNLAYQWGKASMDDAFRRDEMAQNQTQYESDLAYKRDQLAQNQSQYESDLAYKRDQLAQSQSQYDADLAYRNYQAALDEAFRRDQLAQGQSQWEAEQALAQAKFDLQLRQYEDSLLQAAYGGYGGGGGGRKAEAPAKEEALVYPALKQSDSASAQAAPAILSPTATQGLTSAAWKAMQDSMQSAYDRSFQKASQEQAALNAALAATGAPSLAGLMLNAARSGAVADAVGKNKEKSKIKKGK